MARKSEAFWVRERYVPIWRRQNRAHPAVSALVAATRISLTALCALCLVLVLCPPPSSAYDEPISLDLARGSLTAWGIIGTLMALLAASIPMLVWRRRVFSAAVCVGGILGLALIARTDPFSWFHLCTFIYTCLMLVGWLLGLSVLEDDSALLAAAGAALLGGVVCVFSMGIGERVVILSALVGIRGLFWGHLFDEG